jgi:hypothetical protein
MVALHFTHDFTISSVVESTRRVMRTDRQLQSPSPPRPRLVNQDGAGCIRATAGPLSQLHLTLSPFFSNPKIQTTESAHALLEHNFTDGSCTSHACRVGVGSGIKSNVGPLVYKACQLMSTPDRAESVP